MASSPITSWQVEGENVEAVKDFLFMGSNITEVDDCSLEIRRWSLLGRKAMTNLECVLKWRDITLPTKVHRVKVMVLPVAMCGCETWTIKKAERHSFDAFELWRWRRLLRVPRTARRLNQSVLKEINHEYSLEGLMLKLKFQYFGHLMQTVTHWKSTWCWESLRAEEKRASEVEMAGWHGLCNGHELGQTLGDGKGQRGLECCSP